MQKVLMKAIDRNYVFWICLCVSVILIVGGAITPPPFVIDSSIFVAVGELFAFASLGAFISALDKGKEATISHGDTKLTIHGEDEEEVDNV